MTPAELYRQASRQVLVVDVSGADGTKLSSSSALLAGDGRAIAQCGLLDVPGNKVQLWHDGRSHDARAGSEDLKRNLCVLQADGLKGPALHAGSAETLRVGARVFAVSNALGLGISISEGVVSALRELRGERLIQFTASIAPGSEGGGLFDESGRLVGVIRYRKLGGQNVNFAVPAGALAEIERRSAQQAEYRSWYLRASDLYRQKNFDALAELARARTQAAPEELEPRLFLGWAEWARGALDGAESAFREAVARHADELPAHMALVQVLLAAKRYPAAIEASRAAQQLFPEEGGFAVTLGMAEMLSGRHDPARRALEDALRMDPTNVQGLEMLVQVAAAQRDARGAANALRQLASLNSQQPSAWLRLSQAYLSAGKAEPALAAAERALTLQPASGDALLWKGQALAALGRRKESIEVLKVALTREPKAPAFAWFPLAYNYYEVGLFAESIAAYREVLRLEPKNQYASDQLAVALKDAGRLDEAMAMFETARVERPQDPFGWRQVGYVHAIRAKPELAIPALERALELDPKQAKVWHALLENYSRAGRDEDMRRAYRNLEDLDKAAAARAYRQFILPREAAR